MEIYRNLSGFGGLVVKKWLKILVASMFHQLTELEFCRKRIEKNLEKGLGETEEGEN